MTNIYYIEKIRKTATWIRKTKIEILNDDQVYDIIETQTLEDMTNRIDNIRIKLKKDWYVVLF